MDASQPSNPNEVHFDRAEFTDARGAGTTCTQCQSPIPDQYYEINTHIVCARCRDAIQTVLTGGSPAKRTILALVAGVLASAVAAAIYFAVAEITGYEVGLVAIVVGLLVGGAVRWGSQRRGGGFYQGMAIILTYCSICAAYGAWTVKLAYDQIQRAGATSRPVTSAEGEDESAQSDEASEEQDDSMVVLSRLPRSEQIRILASIIGRDVLILPIQVGKESPIGLLIAGFALWEAWKINKRPRIAINGPYAVGGPRP